jgi:hypothetical protein
MAIYLGMYVEVHDRLENTSESLLLNQVFRISFQYFARLSLLMEHVAD